MDIFLVGGAVRDEMLGREVSERDWVVVGATPEEMQALGYKQVGKDFPVFLHPETHDECALARTERKTSPGYHGFEVHADPSVTLEEDLLRRDLTVNAMARDEQGELVDPFNGKADLEARLLRHVSPAFAEDPVRILRIARFAARYLPLGFRIADETMSLMREMVEAGEVDALVPERVWAEMVRALAEPSPGTFVEVLRECGALARILPEIDCLFGVPQPEEHHPEIDTGVHVLMALEQSVNMNASIPVRFAVLMHDLGKGITPKEEWPSHRGHEKSGAELVRKLCARIRCPKEYRDLAVIVAEFHLHSHRALVMRPGKIMKLLQQTDALRRPERFKEFLQACECDAKGRKGLEDVPYPQTDRLREARNAAASVDVKPLLERGLKGDNLIATLLSARIHAIAGVIKELAGGVQSPLPTATDGGNV